MAPAQPQLVAFPGRNKIPKGTGWMWETALEFQVRQLALEFLCLGLREFRIPVDTSLDLQNLLGTSWLHNSAYTIWSEAWLWIPMEHRSSYIARTYSIDPMFAHSALEGIYQALIGRPTVLECMD